MKRFMMVLSLLLLVACAQQPAKRENSASVVRELRGVAMEMSHFQAVRDKVGDLQEVLVIPKDGARNIYMVSDEVYFYSPSLGTTFVQCKDHDALNAVLDGNVKLWSEAVLNDALKPWKENAKKVMEKMGMNSMGEMGDMKEMGHDKSMPMK